MTDDKNKKIAYDFMSEKYDMPSFEQFSHDLEDEANRRMLFDAMSEKYDMPSFEQFSADLIGTPKPQHLTPAETYRQAQPDVAAYDYQGALPKVKATAAPQVQVQERPKPQAQEPAKPQDTPQEQQPVEEAAQAADTVTLDGIQRLTAMRQSLLQQPDTLKQAEANRMRDTMLAVVNNEADAAERLQQEHAAAAQAATEKEQTRAEVATLGKTIEEGMAAESLRLRAERDGNTPLDKLADKDTPWWQKIGSSLYSAEHPTQFAVDSPDMQMWRAAQHKLEASQRTIAEADHNAQQGTLGKWLEQSFVGGVARGFGQHASDVSTWDFGMSDIIDNAALMKALDKADKDEPLSAAEQALLDATTTEYLTNQYFGSEVGRGYKAGSVTAESLPFMLEMIINPASAMGKGAEAMMTRYALKRFGKEAVKKGGEKYAARKTMEIGGRVIGDVAGASTMAATTGAGRVTADAIDRMNTATLNGEEMEWGEAWKKAFLGTTIENYSEMFGAYFEPVLGAAGKGLTKVATSNMGSKIGLAKMHDFVQQVKASDVAKAVADFERHAQWNGMIGEYAEEVAGGVMNALVVGDQTLDRDPETGVFNLSNNIDTFLGVALLGGFMSGVKTAGYRTPKYQARQAMRTADKAALHAFGDDAELWGGIRAVIDNGTVEEVQGQLIELLTHTDYTPDQIHAALEYAHRATAYKGVLNGEQKRRSEGAVDEQQLAHEDAYDRGYEAGEEEQREITVEAAAGGEETSEAQAALDGMRQRIEDDATAEADTEREAARKMLHKDGTIRRATLKELDDNGNHVEVYIVDGNVTMSADGTEVDREQSDSSVVVYDPATGKRRMIDPANDLGVLSLAAAVSAEEMEAQIERSRQQRVQQQLDAATGTIHVEVGQVVQVPGTELQGTVVAISDDGEGITVQTAEGEQLPVLRSDLQRIADEKAMEDYEQRKAEDETAAMEQAEVEAEVAAEEAPTAEPVPFVDGAPDSYEADMEIELYGETGVMERGTVTGRRFRYEDGQLVEDENGRIVEYVDANGDTKHENVAYLDKRVAGYRMPQGATAETAAPIEEAATETQDEVPATEQTEEQPTAEEAADEPMPMVGEEADFMATTPERGHTYIYNETGLSAEEADAFVKNNQAAAEKALATLQKKAPKMGTSIAQYNKAKADHEAKVQAAQAQVDYWNGVAATQRKAEADRMLAEMEAREAQRKAEEAEEAARHAAALAQQQADYEARQQAEAERRAAGIENPMPVITEKWHGATKLDGAKDEIVLPNGERLQGHYVLHEAGASSPSHDPHTWQQTEGFPMDENGSSVNDRDYERDRDAQRETQGIAQDYDQRALQTPVVVSHDGVVLSGNGRTMAGILAAENGTDGKYIDYLREYAGKYGFTAEQVAGMQHPRVSFVPDEALPYNAVTFAKFNAQEMKSQSKTETAVKMGKTVSDELLSRIVTAIRGYDTLGDYYADPNGGLAAVGELLRGGVITSAQLAQMVDGTGGNEQLSAAGREMLENILIGKAFASDAEAVRMLTAVPSMRRRVVQALGEISDNLSLGEEWTLREQLTEAVKLCYEALQHGFKHGEMVSVYARQGVLPFELGAEATAADYNNATVLMLADVLNDSRVTQLKRVFILYNDQARMSASGQTDLFSEQTVKSREEILREVINFVYRGKEQEIQAALAAAEQRRKASVQQNGDAAPSSETSGEGSRGDTLPESGEGRVRENLAGRQPRDLAQAEELDYRLSNEVDENGHQFVLASNGEIAFGVIGEDTNLTPAPILLSEGVITNQTTKAGYGLVHIEARHGEEIRKAGYPSVLAFVEEVAKNYDVIKEGKERDGEQTYLLQLTDKHNNTLMVELSGDGTYYNINTAGIFKTSYGINRREVYNRHTTANQSTEISEESQDVAQSGTQTSSRMNSPTSSSDAPKDNHLSDGKSTNNSETEQENIASGAVSAGSETVEGDRQGDEVAADSTINPETGKPYTLDELNAMLESGDKDKIGRAYQGLADYYNHEYERILGELAKVFQDEGYSEASSRKLAKGVSIIGTKEEPHLSFYLFGVYVDYDFEQQLQPLVKNKKLMNLLKKRGEASASMDKALREAYDNGVPVQLQTEARGKASTEEQRALGEVAVELLRNAGIEVVMDEKEMAEVLAAEERLQMMTVYHGSGAEFDAFDHSHMGEGEGAQAYGWGTYVTEVNGIARSYARSNQVQNDTKNYKFKGKSLPEVTTRPTTESMKVSNNANLVVMKLMQDKSFADAVKNVIDDKNLFIDMYKKQGGKEDSIKNLEHDIEILKGFKESDFEKPTKHLYEVDIPDNNGKNYLGYSDHVDLRERLSEPILSEGFELVSSNDTLDRYEKGRKTIVISKNASGADIYAELEDALGSAKNASLFLSKAGFVGIKYPAQYLTGGRKDGANNYVIFKEEDLQITERIQFLRTSKGEVYGFVKNGKVYIDAKLLNPNTPIHEYTHLWDRALQEKNPELWLRGVELMKQTSLWNEVVNNPAYADIKDDENLVASEVHARLSGAEGAKLLNDMKESAKAEKDIFKKAEQISLIDQLRQWLNDVWQWVKDTMTPWTKEEAQKVSLEEFVNMPIADLVRGRKLLDKEGAAPLRYATDSTNDAIVKFAEEHGISVKAVKEYADAMRRGSLQKAAYAERGIEQEIVIAHDFNFNSLSEFVKIKNAVLKPLHAQFGDIGKLREEAVRKAEEERGLMEAAKKKAEQEANARQKHLDELAMLTDEEIDNNYFSALENSDEAVAREMLNEVARRRGYSSNTDWRDAHAAPGDTGYTTEERRNILGTDSPDLTLEDIALDYTLYPKDYFDNPRGYMYNDKSGLESQRALNDAMAKVKRGEEAMIKVYRAVPTNIKEGSLRSGDWVTPSREYADMHGRHRFDGKYRVIEQEVPAAHLWWDGNDIREWGYDDGKAYKHKNTKNNRKSDELVTHDDNGNVIPPSKRFNKRKSDVRYHIEGTEANEDALFRDGEEGGIDEVNERFNGQLTAFSDGRMRSSDMFELGRPSDILISAKLPNSPITMTQSVLSEHLDKHGFSIDDLKGLPNAIKNPIMVYEWGDKARSSVIITEINLPNQGKISIAIRVEKDGERLSVNKISSIHVKEVNRLIDDINTEKSDFGKDNLKYVDKDKVLNWFAMASPEEASQPNSRLNSAAKIVRNFENPVVSAKNISVNERYRLREEAAPERTGIGYKVFVLKDGALYPPMVANPNGEATPVGVWLDADAAPVAGESKTGRPQVKAGGKGTQGGSGTLAYRPGWHLGEIPYALQFNRVNPETGEKELFPKNFVWAEVEYANDVDYQEEARAEGVNASGKYQHSLAGLKRLPINGSYRYRTNPNPDTDPWIITGAMKVKRILTPSEVDAMVEAAGREPQKRQEGAITDAQVEALNEEIEKSVALREMEDSERGVTHTTYDEALQNARKAGYSVKQFDRYVRNREASIKRRIEETIAKLGLSDKVEVRETAEGLEGRKARAKGWYEPKTGKIVIILDNHRSVDDVLATILHEGVGHYGLRALFGGAFDTFLDNVYEHADAEVRSKINALAAKHGYNFHTATEEYLASLAEEMDFDTADRQSWWQQVKMWFLEMLDKIGLPMQGAWQHSISDNELRYILWRSYQNLANPRRYRSLDPIARAEDIVMQESLGVYAERNGEVATKADEGEWAFVSESSVQHADIEVVNERFNEQLEEQVNGTLPQGYIYQLGMPSAILRSAGVPNLPIELSAERLLKKSEQENHPFDIKNLANLPHALANPIAVFDSRTNENSKVILTELQHEGNNFVVVMRVRQSDNGLDVDVNDIRSLYPKDRIGGVVNWINNGLLRYADKQKLTDFITQSTNLIGGNEAGSFITQSTNLIAGDKALDWLSSASSNYQQEIDNQELNSAAKIVRNFENPTILGENISESGEGVLFRDGEEGTPEVSAREAYDKILKSSSYQFSEAMQDSMKSLETIMKAILGGGKRFRIEDVKGSENAYAAENRLHSENAAQIHAWQQDYFTPIVKAVSALIGERRNFAHPEKYDMLYGELKDYMMAKHGLERNEVMAERDYERYKEEHPEGDKTLADFRARDYAGLTALTGMDNVVDAEAEARLMVEEYEEEHDTDALWQAVNAATQSSLRKLAESGILSAERFVEIRNMYRYYIPLQGFDSKVAEDVYAYMGSDGTMGYGTPIRAAKGRTSKADDPLATISLNGEAAIRNGNRNLMKQHFLRFVEAHPSDVVSVSDVWLRKNDVTGEWEQYFDAGIEEEDSPEEVSRKVEAFEERMAELAESDPDHYKRGSEQPNMPYRVLRSNDRNQHQVRVMRGGKTVVLTINGNPRAAQALNGVTNPDVFTEGVMGKIFNAGQAVNRELSQLYTTRNPEFVLSNFLRDAIYTNSMVWVKEGANYALKFHANFGKTNPATLAVLFTKWENGTLRKKVTEGSAGYTERMFYDFMMHGGETGWTSLRDIERHKKDLHKAVSRERNVAAKAGKALLGSFDIMNRSVENCARFAAFVTSREMGRGMERSIYDAKEVSVNFNKKGAGDKFFTAKGQTNWGKRGAGLSGAGRALFVFFNAGVQGLNNILRAAGRNPWKFGSLAATLFGLGSLVPILAEVLVGDDDDDENAYYNLPEYVRRSNLCFRFSKDMPWITLPLPIEYRAMYGLGELATGAITGKEHYSDAELTKQLISQVSQVLPLDFMEGKGGLHAFIPSAFKPLVEAKQNVSWTGLPIYRKNTYNQYEYSPEWVRAYPSANQQIVEVTKWLNEATGGDDIVEGKIDLNPAMIEYILKGYAGGLFSFPDKLMKSYETIIGERDFEWRNIPFASRVLREGDERTEHRKMQNEYYKLTQDEFAKTEKRLRGYDKIAKSGGEDARGLFFLVGGNTRMC